MMPKVLEDLFEWYMGLPAWKCMCCSLLLIMTEGWILPILGLFWIIKKSRNSKI